MSPTGPYWNSLCDPQDRIATQIELVLWAEYGSLYDALTATQIDKMIYFLFDNVCYNL